MAVSYSVMGPMLSVFLLSNLTQIMVARYKFCMSDSFRSARDACQTPGNKNSNENCRKALHFPPSNVSLYGSLCFEPDETVLSQSAVGGVKRGRCWLDHRSSYKETIGCRTPTHSLLACYGNCNGSEFKACVVDQGDTACVAILPQCPPASKGEIRKPKTTINGSKCQNYTGGNGFCDDSDNDPGGPWCYIVGAEGKLKKEYCYELCTEITCPSINFPDEVELVGKCRLNDSGRIRDGESITFKCKKGFMDSRMGHQNMTCQADGTWDDYLKINCTRRRCLVPPLASKNLTVLGGVKDDYFSSDNLILLCNEGFQDVERQYQSIQCKDNGEWSDSIKINCSRLSCFAPELPANTKRIGGAKQKYAQNDTFEIICNERYWDDHMSRQKVICQADGQWSSKLSMNCTESFCGLPSLPKDSKLAKQKVRFNIRESVEISCFGRNVVNTASHNESQITCMMNEINGVTYWEGARPRCEVMCGNIKVPFHGHITYLPVGDNHRYKRPGTVANFACAHGYSVRKPGEKQAFCGVSGEWIGIGSSTSDCKRLCKKIAIANGEVINTDGLAEFQCITSHQLVGRWRLPCDLNGNLIGELPVCVKRCGNPPEHANLVYRFETQREYFHVNETIPYSCKTLSHGDTEDKFIRCILGSDGKAAAWSQPTFCVEDDKVSVTKSYGKEGKRTGKRGIPSWVIIMIAVFLIAFLGVSVGVSIYFCLYGRKKHKSKSGSDDATTGRSGSMSRSLSKGIQKIKKGKKKYFPSASVHSRIKSVSMTDDVANRS